MTSRAIALGCFLLLGACGGSNQDGTVGASASEAAIAGQQESASSEPRADTLPPVDADPEPSGKAAALVRVGTACVNYQEKELGLQRMALELAPDRPGLREAVEAAPAKMQAVCACMGRESGVLSGFALERLADSYSKGAAEIEAQLDAGRLDEFQDKLYGTAMIALQAQQKIRDVIQAMPTDDQNRLRPVSASCQL